MKSKFELSSKLSMDKTFQYKEASQGDLVNLTEGIKKLDDEISSLLQELKCVVTALGRE